MGTKEEYPGRGNNRIFSHKAKTPIGSKILRIKDSNRLEEANRSLLRIQDKEIQSTKEELFWQESQMLDRCSLEIKFVRFAIYGLEQMSPFNNFNNMSTNVLIRQIITKCFNKQL